MTIHGEYWLPSSPAESWVALTSLETLKRCLEGWTQFEPVSRGEYALTFNLKGGPLEGKLEARARPGKILPESTAQLAGEVEGTAIGSISWRLCLNLEPDSGGSVMKYSLSLGVNGSNPATNGAEIEKASREIFDRFLSALSNEVSSTGDRLHVVPANPSSRTEGGVVAEFARRKPGRRAHSLQLWIWAAVFILIALRLLSYFQG